MTNLIINIFLLLGAKRVAWPPPNDSGLGSPYSENSSVSAQVRRIINFVCAFL